MSSSQFHIIEYKCSPMLTIYLKLQTSRCCSANLDQSRNLGAFLWLKLERQSIIYSPGICKKIVDRRQLALHNLESLKYVPKAVK
jgi:hypothetical protein